MQIFSQESLAMLFVILAFKKGQMDKRTNGRGFTRKTDIFILKCFQEDLSYTCLYLDISHINCLVFFLDDIFMCRIT